MEKVVVAPGAALQLCAAAASAAVVQRVLLAECKTQGHRGRLSRASRRHRGWHRPNPIRGGREGRGGKGRRKGERGEGQPDDNCFELQIGAAYRCPFNCFNRINAFNALSCTDLQ